MLKVLVYGYGNPGRYDDGVGPLIAEKVEHWAHENELPNIYTDSNYQLNIEDAYIIKDFDIVIFADASIEQIDNFCLTEVLPSDLVEFTMHAVSPSFILDLCKKVFVKSPEVYLLHIKGYEFELKEGMSSAAKQNMGKALEHLKGILVNPENLKRQLVECND